MKKILSTKISKPLVNLGMLLLRLSFGLAIILAHGYKKLMKFSEIHPNFMDFLGLGGKISLSLAIFAEFFCAIFIILGLFTRLATIPLLILFAVIIWQVSNFDIFGKGEHAFLFFMGYLAIFIMGPGKYSLDALISKK